MDAADISYAMQYTKVIYSPDRRIDSFGDTRFYFHMVSELMDEVQVCRVRSGWIEAARPRILRPADLCSVEMEGFSPEAERMFAQLKKQGLLSAAIFKYGFQFSRSEVAEEIVHDDIRTVSDRLVQEALASGNPLLAVIAGADDSWEISLLSFMVEMIRQSYETNAFDFKRRGML